MKRVSSYSCDINFFSWIFQIFFVLFWKLIIIVLLLFDNVGDKCSIIVELMVEMMQRFQKFFGRVWEKKIEGNTILLIRHSGSMKAIIRYLAISTVIIFKERWKSNNRRSSLERWKVKVIIYLTIIILENSDKTQIEEWKILWLHIQPSSFYLFSYWSINDQLFLKTMMRKFSEKSIKSKYLKPSLI